MATLERDGGSVYYEDYGRGDRAILLLHGWGMGVRTWDYTLHALRAAGHVVRSRTGSTLTVDADGEQIGRAAASAGVVLTELRPAREAGLEQLFLELTSDSDRSSGRPTTTAGVAA